MSELTAAIYFQPDAYSTNTHTLMGRNAAGESFINGFLRHSRYKTLYAQVNQVDDANQFGQLATRLGVKKPIKIILPDQYAALNEVQTLYYPGPDIDELAFLRSAVNPNGWSICGITHTTSSARVMDAIAKWITAPLQPWDAIICTSVAVKRHVEVILQAELARLQARLGVTRYSLPQLPVIPLGIKTEDFRFSDEDKRDARRTLDIKEDALVVLYMGRLSFHAKAHPMAMYQALELASRRTGQEIVLVEAGWFANDHTQVAFQTAQEECCPSVKVISVDGRDSEQRKNSWAAADLFCSLSDNIQETFGITPIEAMAAGLPVVVSDWDGYKDTVTEEVGFKIPTFLPQPGLGTDLAFRHASGVDNYDYYCGHVCSFVSVDVGKCAEAFTKLITDAPLRHQMGAAARTRAEENYDWAVIIPKYEALWAHLDHLRSQNATIGPQLWPARLDPFAAFSHYSTSTLTVKSAVYRLDKEVDRALSRLSRLYELEMVKFAHQVIPDLSSLRDLLLKVPITPTLVQDVIDGFDDGHFAIRLRALSVLSKLGLIGLVE